MPNRVSEYFKSRAVAEQAMSAFAIDPRVAAAHAEMAEHYEALAVKFDTSGPDGFLPSVPPEVSAP
jgi:hypothetical protein